MGFGDVSGKARLTLETALELVRRHSVDLEAFVQLTDDWQFAEGIKLGGHFVFFFLLDLRGSELGTLRLIVERLVISK